MSCVNFSINIVAAFVASGEVAQRQAEGNRTDSPADTLNVLPFTPPDIVNDLVDPVVVWSSGGVVVTATQSNHIAGHASYRVDTPAGSVVIAGDAGNDESVPPRPTSTSEQVEQLAEGADVIVHSTIHPVMGPDAGSGFPPPIFYRQSTATDIGAMGARLRTPHIVLTHLIPPLGAELQGPIPFRVGPCKRRTTGKPFERGNFGVESTSEEICSR